MVVHDRTRLTGSLFLFFFCFFGLASGSATENKGKSLADEAFVVETTDEDASASLNRISGHIDLGLADPAHIYKSENHAKSGPFAGKDQHDGSSGY